MELKSLVYNDEGGYIYLILTADDKMILIIFLTKTQHIFEMFLISTLVSGGRYISPRLSIKHLVSIYK